MNSSNSSRWDSRILLEWCCDPHKEHGRTCWASWSEVPESTNMQPSSALSNFVLNQMKAGGEQKGIKIVCSTSRCSWRSTNRFEGAVHELCILSLLSWAHQALSRAGDTSYKPSSSLFVKGSRAETIPDMVSFLEGRESCSAGQNL